MEKVFGSEEVKVLETVKGRKLKGLKYQPLFSFVPPLKPAHYVALAEYVTTEDGTGLVHIAPAFGAEDMGVAKQYDLLVIDTHRHRKKLKRRDDTHHHHHHHHRHNHW